MKKNYLKSCLAALALLTAPLSLSALEKADASAQHGIFIIDGKKVLLK